MKKIIKARRLATLFHDEVEKLEKKGLAHAQYKSGPFRAQYYEDVFMDLLVCQSGLCAYTEELITVKHSEIAIDWTNGKHSGPFKRKDFDATIDHFDPDLKGDRGWLFSNLFVVCTGVNTHKGEKKVDSEFKPDRPDYDPTRYMKYNFSSHQFVPNPDYVNRHPDKKALIDEMIEALGLNIQTFRDRRQEYLEPFKVDIINGEKTYEQIGATIRRFHTAFEMSMEGLSSRN